MSNVKLRSKEELEQELNVQISLGTVTSLEDAIKKGLATALEYGALSLFDGIRRSVARHKNLPDYIVQFLINDRDEVVVGEVYKNHFSKLTPKQQEEFFTVASTKKKSSGYYYGPEQYYRDTCINLFEIGLAKGDEASTLRAYNTGLVGSSEYSPKLKGAGPLENLRKFPNLIKILYEKWPGVSVINLFHPDSNIRKEALRKVFEEIERIHIDSIKERCTNHYAGYKSQQRRVSKTKYSEELQKLFVTDPDADIRQTLLEKTTNVTILKLLAENETDTGLKLAATRKAIKLEKRYNYSKKYNEKKKTQPIIPNNNS